MEDIILIGGGGHCKSVLDVIEQENKFRIAGIVDNNSDVVSILGYSLLGSDDDLTTLRKKYKYAVITVGFIHDNSIRKKLIELLTNLDFTMPSIISPRAYISKHAHMGIGNVIMHDVVINAGARLGNHNIINTKALIEHDASIGDHCHISTAAVVNGGVIIEDDTFWGSNTTSQQYSKARGFIKAGGIVK